MSFGNFPSAGTYNGTNCSIPDLCLNGGTCVNNADTNLTECDCLIGFFGDGCVDGSAPHFAFVVFEIIVLLYLYLGLAVLVDEYLVPAIDKICETVHMPDEVAGATLVAFGSALPDMLATTIGIATDNSNLGMGGVVGSATIAFALIPGLCGLMVRAPSPISAGSLTRDALAFGAGLGLLIYFCSDDKIETWEAGCLVGLYAVYLLVVLVPTCCRRKLKKRKSSVVSGSTRSSLLGGENDVETARRNAVGSAGRPGSYGTSSSSGDNAGELQDGSAPVDIVFKKQLSLIQEEEVRAASRAASSMPSNPPNFVTSMSLTKLCCSCVVGCRKATHCRRSHLSSMTLRFTLDR
mgnify:FL=1